MTARTAWQSWRERVPPVHPGHLQGVHLQRVAAIMRPVAMGVTRDVGIAVIRAGGFKTVLAAHSLGRRSGTAVPGA